MKYSVGQKVKIRSLEWYRDNVNRYGIIECGKYEFFEPMNEYCGKVVTIKRIDDDNYRIDTDKGAFCWTDEMIEGLAEDETKPKFKVGDKIKLKSTLLNDIFGIIGYESEGYMITNISNGLTCFMSYSIEHCYELVEEENEKKLSDESWRYKNIFDSSQYPQSFECPEGYIFKDENGNVINATKIVLEKKKKEYPKTYEECCQYLGCDRIPLRIIGEFTRLINARNAYWKIAGDEMGLGKPWEPDWCNEKIKYCLVNIPIYGGVCKRQFTDIKCILAFPTEEMRDAFKENFGPDIEICKELL